MDVFASKRKNPAPRGGKRGSKGGQSQNQVGGILQIGDGQFLLGGMDLGHTGTKNNGADAVAVEVVGIAAAAAGSQFGLQTGLAAGGHDPADKGIGFGQ